MKRAVVCLLLLVCSGVAIYAQDAFGSIGGTVLDPSGAVVANAKISVINTDRNQVVRTITTDDSGVYTSPLLPAPGTYTVKAEAAGFKTNSRTGIALNVSDDLKINISMEVGALTETVEVKESAVQVELGTPSDSTVIEGTQVRELALGTRNFAQLVGLMPGVASNAVDELFVGVTGASGTTTTIPFFVNGMRNSSNNWTVDGADNVDRGSNLSLGSFPSVDATAQFKVERSTYTADTGRAGGAQINVVTKSGTSQYHGSIYEFFRNDALNANPWTNNANKVNLINRTDPNAACTNANYLDCYAKRTPVRWNNFGGTFGGPISFAGYNREKNKTFFFSEEVRRIINYATFNPTLPTQGMLQGN